MKSTWNRIIGIWRDSSIDIRPGVSTDAINEFQNRHNVVMPEAVCDFFRTTDGTGDDMDNDMYRFWPLQEVKLVEDELADTENGTVYDDRYAYPNCFVFADYCIWCWAYAVRLTDDPNQPAPVFRVTADKKPGEQMASSFIEFMSQYAEYPDNII